MEMYRDGIACVATMDISRLCFRRRQDSRAAKHKNLNYRIVNAIA
jgi:hypothetical protein